MGVKAKGMLRGVRVNQVTSASLRYPLSVFNKNSTLKEEKKKGRKEKGGKEGGK